MEEIPPPFNIDAIDPLPDEANLPLNHPSSTGLGGSIGSRWQSPLYGHPDTEERPKLLLGPTTVPAVGTVEMEVVLRDDGNPRPSWDRNPEGENVDPREERFEDIDVDEGRRPKPKLGYAGLARAVCRDCVVCVLLGVLGPSPVGPYGVK